MRTGLVIADAGPIFSLALLDKLNLLEQLFDDIKIPSAVWTEITFKKDVPFYSAITSFFNHRILEIEGVNDLTFLMDLGESEAIILYRQLKADFLLIDDKKARQIAESYGINCVGTLALLSVAKDRKLIKRLRPIFLELLQKGRYYSLELLNAILLEKDEEAL